MESGLLLFCLDRQMGSIGSEALCAFMFLGLC